MSGRLMSDMGIAGGAEDHQRTAELNAIATGQVMSGDSAAVDEAAVAAAQIDQCPIAIGASVQASMVPGDFSIVQLNLIGRLASKRRRLTQQFKMLAAVSAANDEQGCHRVSHWFHIIACD